MMRETTCGLLRQRYGSLVFLIELDIKDISNLGMYHILL